jgi:hypothetical protein
MMTSASVTRTAIARVAELSGRPDEVNTVANPRQVALREKKWRHELADGESRYTFPAHSVTVVRLE